MSWTIIFGVIHIVLNAKFCEKILHPDMYTYRIFFRNILPTYQMNDPFPDEAIIISVKLNFPHAIQYIFDLALSSEDEYDRTISPKNSNSDSKYKSQNSLSPESLNKSGGSLSESQASHGSTSSLDIKFDKKNALGVKGLIRKISKTGSYTSSEADSVSLNHNVNSSQRDNDDVSETSSNSTREIDDMFKSYGSEQMRKMQEESETDKDSDSQFSKQEYHGISSVFIS